MKYYFHPEARKEFLEAIDYYESCQSGLGVEFANEVQSAIQRIVQFPNSWTVFSENTGRCLVKRFPFGIIYKNVRDKDEIILIAVMQVNRKPDYWKHRK